MSNAPDSVVQLNRPARLYGHKIRKAWQSSVESILEAGRLLTEAKANLHHGDFERMVKAECPFSKRTAEKLMSIAAHPVLSNTTHVSVLPNAWGTLAELARFDPKELSHAIRNHWVKPDMAREDVKLLHARTQKALGTRKRMPPQNPAKPRPFAAQLRSVMADDVLEWLGTIDRQAARSLAERVAQLIADYRKGVTDG